MIARMSKVILLCTRASQTATLDRLRDLGVMDISSVRIPQSDDLDKARSSLSYVQRALDVLPKHTDVLRSGEEPERIVSAVWKIIQENEDLADRLEQLKGEAARIEPFGQFNPEQIRALRERGVFVKLYSAGPKYECRAPEGAVCVELERDRDGVYFVIIAREDVEIDAHEIRLPQRGLARIREAIEETQHTIERNERRLHWYAGDRTAVEGLVQQARDRVWYLEVKHGMGETEPVVYLQGFIPKSNEEAVRSAAAENGWGVVFEEPTPSDRPPTLVRMPNWVKPIRAVFDMIGVVPGYEEVDISALFLLFLSLFFAMLVGDAGYGLLFLGLTLGVRFGMKKVPRQLTTLLMIMSVCTIVWGVLTGTYFGITKALLPAPLRAFSLGWLSGSGEETNEHIMLLCFLIGAIHLTLAHAWNAVRFRGSLTALSQLGWIGMTWTMFFAARSMVLGKDFPVMAGWVMGGGGALLILLFMTPVKKIKEEWFNFVTFPLDVVSNFVDVVSYVRLFAVGAASFAVANAFNQMAAEMWGGVLGGIGAALIVFFGHILNILLAAMGVLVHGIRLNTLEFSSHLGMQWTGRKFNPFRRLSEETTG